MEHSRMNARCDGYQLAAIFGREVLLTRSRIDRSTVPIGMRMYEILADDSGNPAELAHSFIGEKYGTIITNRYIPLNNGWRVIGRRDLRIDGDSCISLREFMTQHPPKKKTRQMFGQ